MQLDIASATILAAGIGAIVAGGVSAINAWFTHRSDERRQIRELAVRVGIEEWKAQIELAQKYHSKIIHPLDLYLVHAMYFVRLLGDKIKCEDQLRSHLRNSHSMTDIANQEIKNYSKKDNNHNTSQQAGGGDG